MRPPNTGVLRADTDEMDLPTLSNQKQLHFGDERVDCLLSVICYHFEHLKTYIVECHGFLVPSL